jgi:hypothetical protein
MHAPFSTWHWFKDRLLLCRVLFGDLPVPEWVVEAFVNAGDVHERGQYSWEDPFDLRDGFTQGSNIRFLSPEVELHESKLSEDIMSIAWNHVGVDAGTTVRQCVTVAEDWTRNGM